MSLININVTHKDDKIDTILTEISLLNKRIIAMKLDLELKLSKVCDSIENLEIDND